MLNRSAFKATAARKQTPAAIVIHLPLLPPSANRLWRRAGQRIHKSAKYAAWLRAMGLLAKSQIGRSRIAGPYKLSVLVARPDRRRRDLDNFAFKAVNDLLVGIGAVDDDCLCDMVSARWLAGGEGIGVRIEQA